MISFYCPYCDSQDMHVIEREGNGWVVIQCDYCQRTWREDSDRGRA